MNIQVRVAARQAMAEIKAMEAQLARMRATQAAANRTGAAGNAAATASLTKLGSQTQWAGRQLTYNFSIPIALAGGYAMKFALDNEKAMTRVKKVYGDNSPVFNKLAEKEVPALGQAFEALSNEFGVNQAAVINIGADWAAAGASGLALAKSVKLTMQTMVLGEMDATESTRALIAIQAQYGFGIAQLEKTIDELNMTENQTGTSLEDLIVSMSKAAGTARDAGVDTLHLSAMVAALVPAAGTAAQAGNGLKTILSRILKPTKEAADVMEEMGIKTESAAWESKNGAERLEILATKFKGLSGAQRTFAATAIAGRYQLNRMQVLMRAMAKGSASFYNKTLKSSADETKNYTQKQKELNAVLNSQPQQFKQIGVVLQNSAARIIGPLIPLILAMARAIQTAVEKFTELPPHVQKLVAVGLLLLALFGPLLRYIGATMTLIGFLGKAFLMVGKVFLSAGKFFLAPFMKLYSIAAKVLPWVGKALMSTARVLIGPFLAMFGLALSSASSMLALLARGMATVFLAISTLIMRVITTMMAGVLQVIARYVTVMLTTLAAGGARMAAALLMPFVVGARAIPVLLVRMATTVGVVMAGWATRIIAIFGVMAARVVATWTAMWAWIAAGGLMNVARAMIARFAVGIVAIFTRLGPLLIRAFASPWFWVITAVVALVSAFRDKIADIWDKIVGFFQGGANGIADAFAPIVNFFWKAVEGVVNAFNALPEGVQNAIMAVVRIVRDAALQVYEWFSYLNPFAHHSPSLVEQVTKGMAVIRKEYGSVGNVGAVFKKAAADLKAFKSAAAGLIPGEWADEIKDIKSQFPQLLPMFMTLLGDLKTLNAILAKQKVAVDAQQAVVDRWQKKLDAANQTLTDQQTILDGLTNNLSKLQDKYDSAESAMQNFAQAPIKGMQEFSDKIFENDLAQKKLQLQMLQWEKQNGSIDSLNDKFAALNGELQGLQGEADALKKKGAGSDILGPINDQIAALQAQSSAVADQIKNSPVGQLQDQMDALARDGEILQLQNDIKFDPLVRQIDNLANAQKELSYQDIIDGINKQKAAMEKLAPQIADATKKVNDQQKVVDDATAARDRAQAGYDRESKKLKTLQDAYDVTKQKIDAITEALNSVSGAANQAASAMAKGDGASSFANAAKGNFADPGGAAGLGREGGLTDQSAAIKAFTQESQEEMAKQLGNMDMFGPLKDMWKKATDWMKTYLGPVMKAIGDIFSVSFKAIGEGLSNMFKSDGASKVGGFFAKAASMIGSAIKFIISLFKLFWPDIKRVFIGLGDIAKNIWTNLVPSLVKFWNAVKPIVAIIAVALIGAIKILITVWTTALFPALNSVVDILSGVFQAFAGVINIIKGVFKFIYHFITGDWGKLWDDFKEIVGGAVDWFIGTFKAIWGIIGGALKLVVNLVKGFVDGIVEFFTWLYDVLVGHSIIPDMMKAILKWFNWIITPAKVAFKALWAGFKWAWDNIAMPVYRAVKSAIEAIPEIISGIINGTKKFFGNIWDALKTIWENSGQVIFDAIKSVIQWIPDKISKILTGTKTFFSSIWSGLKGIWDKTGKPIFQSAKDAIQWIPDKIGKILSTAKTGYQAVFTGLKGVWDKYGKPVFDTVKSVIQSIVDKIGAILKPVKQGFQAIWDGVSTGLSIFKTGIQTAWDALKGIFKAPINWVITHVINGGLIKGWNWVADKVNFGHVSPVPGFAEGGVVPGYAPGRDSIPAVLSPGEGILRPEVVRALGKGTIDMWNRMRGLGKPQAFKDGGVAGGNKHFKTPDGKPINFKVGASIGIGDLNPMKYIEKVKDFVMSPLRAIFDAMGDKKWVEMIAKAPIKILESVVDVLKKKITDIFLGQLELSAKMKKQLADIAKAKEKLKNTPKSPNTGTPGRVGQNKNGTKNWPGGWSMVGEGGPELVNLPKGSDVFNNSATVKMVATLAARVASRLKPSVGVGSAANTTSQSTTNNYTTYETHINVDKIEMPNITSADDAEEFIANLKSFATGSI